MKNLTLDKCLKLARSKNYEEFIINKDLLGFHNKKFCQKLALNILQCMAAYQHDAELACQIINEGKHIQIGDFLKYEIFDCYYQCIEQKYVKDNLHKIYKAICRYMHSLHHVE